MATVTTSIGGGTSHNHNAAISAVSGSGPYTVTIAANTSVNGDALWDEHATPRKYLITGGGGTTSLTVEDSTGVGAGPDNSGTSSSQITRYYNGSTPITDWESELDDTNLYSALDDALGECYKDATFTDGAITINGGGTVGLNSAKLTAASGEQHDGTASSGVRLTGSIKVTSNSLDVTLEYLEVEGSTSGVSFQQNTSNVVGYAFRNIVHGVAHNNAAHLFGFEGFVGGWNVLNNIIYDVDNTTGGTQTAYGVRHSGSQTRNTSNNTVFNINRTGDGSAFAYGFGDDSDFTLQNNIGMDVTVTGTTTSEKDFEQSSPANATVSYNLDSDSSLENDGTNVRGQTSGDQFVNTGTGTEDLHLKAGADAIDVGTDLVVTPTGVNIDIDGRDRDAEGDTWDIGAHEFVASGIATILNTLVIQAVNRASTY